MDKLKGIQYLPLIMLFVLAILGVVFGAGYLFVTILSCGIAAVSSFSTATTVTLAVCLVWIFRKS